jgi:FMN phosphatase YigB (HAD superfamily)
MGARGPGRRLDVDVVTLSFHGALVDWRSAVEAVLYDVARAHGESPLDRGRALRRRLEALGLDDRGRAGFAAAFDALAAERAYRWARRGEDALQRVVQLCRPYDDVAPALERALWEGLPVIAVADSDVDAGAVHAALRPLDGAIADVVAAPGPRAALAGALRRAGVPAERVLHVGAVRQQLVVAAGLGIQTAWLNRIGAVPRRSGAHCAELRSLEGLCDLAAGRRAMAAG